MPSLQRLKHVAADVGANTSRGSERARVQPARKIALMLQADAGNSAVVGLVPAAHGRGVQEIALMLQAQAGNTAVAGLIQATRGRGDGGALLLQREVVVDPVAGPLERGEHEGLSLPPEERGELIREVGQRMNRAYPTFIQAVNDNRAAVKAAAKDKAEMIGLIFETVCSFALPVLATGLAHIAEKMSKKISTPVFKAALGKLNEERTKILLENVARVGKTAVAADAERLYGEGDLDEFFKEMIQSYNVGIDAIDIDLTNRHNDELGVLWAAYDPSVASLDSFRAAVEGRVDIWQHEVEPIGERGGLHNWKAADVEFPHSVRRLAIIQDASPGDFDPSGAPRPAGQRAYTFVRWVSPEFRGMAVKKTQSTFGKVEIIPAEKVDRLPPFSWMEAAKEAAGG